ncbi:uncharacterized protein LOC142771738 [Rhipicephalus microplus]|uniref:uncharacterized protein LOC142771738 n=1 Tax=Rhipicephalus microplus TaxID=6941 RepID=UPI003F6A90BE
MFSAVLCNAGVRPDHHAPVERNQYQRGSQSQEETELLTERSRWRLAYFVLCLGNSIVAVVLFILVLRLVWYAEANWLAGIVLPGKNASEVSEGQASARVYCLDAGACKDAYASILRESIDADADPCHNFYNYACGGWLRNHEESTALTAWRQYTNDAIEQLRLARVSARVRGESVAQAAHFLDTCLQVGRKPESGTNTEVDIKEVFAEAALRWPERSEHSDLANSLFFMARRVALPVFFDVDSGYTKDELGTILFRLDTTFQKTTSRLVDLLKKGSLSRFVRLLYRVFAVDGIVNETRFDEVMSGLESLADVLYIYLKATDDRTTVRDLASLKLYAPPVSFEMWSSAFRKFFNFDFAELNTTIIYDVRSFSAIFRHVLVYGEAIMKDVFGFLSIMAAVWYTSSEIRDAFFGSSMDASFHQKQFCSISLYEFYGDALNHFFFEKARSELKMFKGLQALMWNEFPRIVGPNGTLVGEEEPLPRANHLYGVSEFLRKSEPKVFLPRYKSYPNLTNSPLRNWIALTDNKRKQLGFDYNDSYVRQKHTSCASQCDATIFKWRLTPYHLTFPWYSSGIHRSILFAGLATRIAAAIFLDYVYRNELQRERFFEENQKCLQSMNPDLDEAPDVRLQAGVAAVLASSALLNRTSRSNSSLIGSGTYSLDGVGDVKESEEFFVFGCHLLCGDDDAERLCNLPLRHSVQFAHAFNCEVDTNMNPRRKCHLRV